MRPVIFQEISNDYKDKEKTASKDNCEKIIKFVRERGAEALKTVIYAFKITICRIVPYCERQ